MGTHSQLQQSGNGRKQKNVVRSAPTWPALINRIICVWLKQTDCRRNASFLLTFSFLFFFCSSGQLSRVRWGISLTETVAGVADSNFPRRRLNALFVFLKWSARNGPSINRISMKVTCLERQKLRYSTNKVRKNSKCPTDVDRFPRHWRNHIFHPKKSRFETAGESRQPSHWTRRQFFLRRAKVAKHVRQPTQSGGGSNHIRNRCTSGHSVSTFNRCPVNRWHHCSPINEANLWCPNPTNEIIKLRVRGDRLTSSRSKGSNVAIISFLGRLNLSIILKYYFYIYVMYI